MRALIDARERGDIDRVMSFYTPEVVVFDCPPKLRLRGKEEYRRSFQKWSISAFRFPVKYEVREQSILTSEKLASVHGKASTNCEFLFAHHGIQSRMK